MFILLLISIGGAALLFYGLTNTIDTTPPKTSKPKEVIELTQDDFDIYVVKK